MFQVHKNWEMGHFSDPDYLFRVPCDGPWPSWTKAGTPNRTFFLVGQIRGVFSFRGYPRHGPFSRLAPPKGKSCDRPWDSMVCNDVLLPRSIEVNMGMLMNAWRNKTFIWFGFPWDNLMDCLRISRLFSCICVVKRSLISCYTTWDTEVTAPRPMTSSNQNCISFFFIFFIPSPTGNTPQMFSFHKKERPVMVTWSEVHRNIF